MHETHFKGKGSNMIINIMNTTKKVKYSHYTPVFYGEINLRPGKAKLNTLQVLLYYGARYSIVLVKHTQTLWN